MVEITHCGNPVHTIGELPAVGSTARAIVVLDEHDKVLYTEFVQEIRQEPKYDQALAALK